MVILRYCSPMEIQRAMQEPQNATVDILEGDSRGRIDG
jgi:hypothetical protein